MNIQIIPTVVPVSRFNVTLSFDELELNELHRIASYDSSVPQAVYKNGGTFGPEGGTENSLGTFLRTLNSRINDAKRNAGFKP